MSDEDREVVLPLSGPITPTVIIIFVIILVLSIGAFSISVLCSYLQCPVSNNFDPMRLRPLLSSSSGAAPNHAIPGQSNIPQGALNSVELIHLSSDAKCSVSNSKTVDIASSNNVRCSHPNGTAPLCKSASPVLQRGMCDLFEFSYNDLFRSKSEPCSINCCQTTYCQQSCQSRSFNHRKAANPINLIPPEQTNVSSSPNLFCSTQLNRDPLSSITTKISGRPLMLSISRDIRGKEDARVVSRYLECDSGWMPGECLQGRSVQCSGEMTANDCQSAATLCPRPSSNASTDEGDCFKRNDLTATSLIDLTYSNEKIMKSVKCASKDSVYSVSINIEDDKPIKPNRSLRTLDCYNIVSDVPTFDLYAAVGDTLDDLDRHILASSDQSDDDYFSTHSDISPEERPVPHRHSLFSANSLPNHIGSEPP